MKNRKLIYTLLALILLAFGILVWNKSQTSGELQITKQPENVTVSYPDGASFEVKVNKPKLVESYQWVMEDVSGNLFVLEGSSAKTSKLTVPSTTQDVNDLYFYCIITDVNGNEFISEKAVLNEDNAEEDKTVLYLGEFAIEPGETLDLARTDIGEGRKLGSGVITFDANGTDITLDNVSFDNTYHLCDFITGENVGFALSVNHNDKEEYNVTFIGDNVIYNSYFDPDYNMAGIPFDFYFLGEDGVIPLINLTGEGTLTITNGSIALRAIGDLMVGIDVTVKQDRKNYGDGIYAQNMMIGEGTKLDLEVYGTALYASGNLYLKDTDIDIDANGAHISMGMAAKHVVTVGNFMRMEGTDLNVSFSTDHDVTASVATCAGITVSNDLEAYDSTYTFGVDVRHADEIYVSNILGVSAANATFDNCRVAIDIDSRDIFTGFGIYTDGYTLFTDSDVKVNVHTNGAVFGIAPEGDFSAEESNVDVTVDSYDDYENDPAYGIMCDSLVLKLTEAGKTVRAYSANGMAVGCNLNQTLDDPVSYRAGYAAQKIFLREGTVCTVPENPAVSVGGVQKQDFEVYYLLVETYYSSLDTSAPAREVVFAAGE